MTKLVLFALLVLANVCKAQSTPYIVYNPNAPAGVMTTTANVDDLLAGMTIASQSSKTITSVSFGVLVSIPGDCGGTPYLSKEHGRTMQTKILPKETVSFTDLRMSSRAMQRLALAHGAPDVFIEVAVVGATFEDGTHWALQRAGKTYDDSLLAREIAIRCHSGAISGLALRSVANRSCVKGQLVRVQAGYNGGIIPARHRVHSTVQITTPAAPTISARIRTTVQPNTA